MSDLAWIHTEQAFLAACLLAEKAPIISSRCFYRIDHAEIAAAMQKLESQGTRPDLPSVGMAIDPQKAKASYLAELLDQAPSVENIEVYARIVAGNAAARRVRLHAEQFLTALGSPGSKKTTDALADLQAGISCACESGFASIGNGDNGISAFMADLFERASTGKRTGLETGIHWLDEVTSGMAPQDLWILAARPSQGKTALSLQMGRHVALDRDVLYFSLEMSREAIYARLLSTESKINLAKIRSANFRAEELHDVEQASKRVEKLRLTILDRPHSELDIVHEAKSRKPSLVIVDHLTKVRVSNETGNKNNDYGRVTNALKGLAKELNIPVMVLSQLSRMNEREGRPPQESDLRDSGEIEQDADVILFIHSKDKALPDRELILAKQRQGQLAKMKFFFRGAYQIFEELRRE